MLRRTRLQSIFLSVCSMVKPIGKPDAGNPPVRFDERGWETERCQSAPSNRAHPIPCADFVLIRGSGIGELGGAVLYPI